MKRQNRSETYTTVEVPVSKLYESDLAASYLPHLSLLADSELKRMGPAGRAELERREQVRAEHVKAGRALWVRQTKGYRDETIWVVTREKKGKERDRKGHLLGAVAQGPYDGKQLALMMLEHHDEGGVVYVEGGGFYKDVNEVVDLRPNECEALATTGKHDWFYVPTGDDVCRACGLVT